MPQYITEDMIEQSAIALLRDTYQYQVLNCYTVKPEDLNDTTGRKNKKQVVLPSVMEESLIKINPHIPESVIFEQVKELCKTPASNELLQTNYNNYKKIRDKITVEFEKNSKKVSEKLQLIDFNNPSANTFIVASQMWIQGEFHWRRPDLLLFVNGFPLVFIELKNSNILVKNAYDCNLKNYLKDIPSLYHYNQICVLSNGRETKLGSFSAGYEFYFEWLKIETEKENPNREEIKEKCISLEYFLHGLCDPVKLLDYIENFILYEEKRTKIIAKTHQFLGVNNAFYVFLDRKERKGKLGVFWHTQGSGKSYSMIMLARKIKRKCSGNYTFLIVTDREDLDGQIYKNFLHTEFVSENEKVRPANSEKLREALKKDQSILFTLIHKFRYDKGKKYPILSERDDIIVFVDEAHRTQYKDLAENMRTGLPNAQFIAFTGTPLLGNKNLTYNWFGEHVISEYNFAESIKDKSTVPLYYIKRVPEVALKNDFLDSDFADIVESENLTEQEKTRLENYYAKELEVIKRDDRLDTIAKHIAYHFPRRGFRGKAMVISVDKFTAVRMYDKVNFFWKEEIKNLNGEISKAKSNEEKQQLKDIVEYMRKVEMAVVISEDADEEKKFAAEGLNIKPHRERMNRIDENGFNIEYNFKDPEHPLQIVFVCAMWLTGFDAKSISTLYLDKPMKGHTLMQTIARANRVYVDKECGLIVDYLDVFKYLERALAVYAGGNENNKPVKEIDKLFSQLLEAIESTKAFCSKIGIDFNCVLGEDKTFKEIALFDEFANILVETDDRKNQFFILANTVENLYNSLRPDIFFMDFNPDEKNIILYLRAVIEGKIRPEKIESARLKINELLDQSVITADEAKNYTITDSGKELNLASLDIDELRSQFKKVKCKNLEIDNLRKYLEEKLYKMLKRNCTRASFAERFRNIINEYNAGGSQNDDFYEKLLKFMEDLKAEEERHVKEELSETELEIFDLLRKDRLTKEEEKKVKLAAKKLYTTLIQKYDELFVVGWQNDSQPKEKVKNQIITVLNEYLPLSYDREIFQYKTTRVFEHILDQAQMGYNWVA